MFIKIKSSVLALGFLMPLALAAPSFAATPITTFGVTATVQAGCSVSAAKLPTTYSAAMEKASSAVTVSCTNTTQYVVRVVPLNTTVSSVAIGNLNFPVLSLTNYAMSSPVRNLPWRGTANSGSVDSFPQPRFAFNESALRASSSTPDAISVAITY